jgi:uncharacterized membrane protein YoaK (UPF0700 family)
MFRHTGKHRTLSHNIKLASLLSLVAGIVNVTGFFSVQTLTTNVTGHFAFFADEMVRKSLSTSLIYLFYILSFLLGAFLSGILVEIIIRKNSRYIYVIPITVEIIILISVSLLKHDTVIENAQAISCWLLFAMGLQNALVTSISNAVVRTTHLTGLFTDLGIELSQLFFYKEERQSKKIQSSIKLRLVIISFFFIGCVAGGYGYFYIGMYTLLFAALLLVIGLLYDNLKYQVVLLKRKYLK